MTGGKFFDKATYCSGSQEGHEVTQFTELYEFHLTFRTHTRTSLEQINKTVTKLSSLSHDRNMRNEKW